MDKKYDIFISYRRDGGSSFARSIELALEQYGYSVFLDFDELKDGKFDQTIMNAIDSAPIFLVVMSNKVFDRCSNENDWVRLEIEYAIKQNKHIIPIDPNKEFNGFPETLPKHIKEALGQHQFSDIMFGQLFKSSIDLMINTRIRGLIKKQGVISNNDTRVNLLVDMDCMVYDYDQEILKASANEYTAIYLNKGEHVLRFVSIENPNLQKTISNYLIKEAGLTMRLDVNLERNVFKHFHDLISNIKTSKQKKIIKNIDFPVFDDNTDKSSTREKYDWMYYTIPFVTLSIVGFFSYNPIFNYYNTMSYLYEERNINSEYVDTITSAEVDSCAFITSEKEIQDVDSVELNKSIMTEYLQKAEEQCDNAEKHHGQNCAVQILLDANYYYYDKANQIYKKLNGSKIPSNERINTLIRDEFNYWVEKGNSLGKSPKNYKIKKECYERAYKLVPQQTIKARIEWLEQRIK